MSGEKPILFSGPMVRALLEGRKSQTRRLINTKATARGGPYLFDGSWTDSYVMDPGNASRRERSYPYRIGDRLWVREALTRSGGYISYAADFKVRRPYTIWPHTWKQDPRPSIHMPRNLSRLTLTVTDVRVQRLQEISEEDARAEGLSWVAPSWGIPGMPETWGADPRAAFSTLWNSLHGSDAWSANPWVVAVSFTVARQNIDTPAPTEESRRGG